MHSQDVSTSCATAVDELSLDASCGQLEVSILSGDLDEATTQYDFLQVSRSKYGLLWCSWHGV
jgi:hypothetical protein